MSDDPQLELMTRILKEHDEKPHPGLEGGRLRIHVAIHVVVETQLKLGEPPEIHRTLERLMRQGLDRHEAIHAIGSVASEEVLTCLSPGRVYDEQRYIARLMSLSAESWLGTTGDDGSSPTR